MQKKNRTKNFSPTNMQKKGKKNVNKQQQQRKEFKNFFQKRGKNSKNSIKLWFYDAILNFCCCFFLYFMFQKNVVKMSAFLILFFIFFVQRGEGGLVNRPIFCAASSFQEKSFISCGLFVIVFFRLDFLFYILSECKTKTKFYRNYNQEEKKMVPLNYLFMYWMLF